MEEENDDESWIWLSFASKHRIILACEIGPRNQIMADKIVEKTVKRIDKKNLPLFVTDGLKAYETALKKQFFEVIEFEKTGKRGRPRKAKRIPHRNLRYGQVVKKRENGRIVKVHKRIICGSAKNIEMKDITTSLIERQNLTLRQENHRLARKTLGFSKKNRWLEFQSSLYMTYYNFCRSHDSLKIVDWKHVNGKIWKKFRKQTPMLSIGKTDHIWTLGELLRFPIHKISTD